MKQALTTLLLVGATASAFGQGTINFANGAAGLNAPIFGTDGTTPLAGYWYIAQLWAGSSATSLAPITPTATFGTGASAGYFFGGARTIPTVPQGSQAYFQVRVWLRVAGIPDSPPPTVVGGDRASRNGPVLGPYLSPPLGGGVTPPPNLLGLQSFSLYVVPEPSALALGVLGAAGLLVLRRRR